MVEYSPIPDVVRELVRERVQAIEQIEVLLLLRVEALRDQADAYEPKLVAERLRLSESVVRAALAHLAAGDLLAESAAGFAYRPRTEALAAAVDALATCYADARVEMLRLISANAVERLRSSSLKVFAEAFRLRRRKKDDG
jgi:hypothetical protein